MPPKIRDRGRLYAQADQFKAALAASETAAADQMLAAWTDSYWGVRRELDGFLAKVAKARAEGVAPGVSWAYQERRLRNVLDETKVQINRYAADASQVTSRQQRSAINAAAAHADRLTRTAVEVSLPGLEATFGRINPADLESMVGFLANGSVLRNHLAATLPAETADAVKAALIHGLATGKSQDWMTRQATRALGISHGRAITIMRTESLRAYRATSKAVYQANRDIVGEWTWHAALDSRCCMGCVAMHGTHHPVDADLDGHPRCRCAMVPRTRSWSDILGPDGDDIPDSRPAIETGEDWFTRQTPSVQRGLMGGQKFDAWQKGEFTLPEVVARTSDPDWGTMRTERSLKAIREGRNANWMDAPVPGPSAPAPAPVAPPVAPTFTHLDDDALMKHFRETKDPNARAEVLRRSKARSAAFAAKEKAELEAARAAAPVIKVQPRPAERPLGPRPATKKSDHYYQHVPKQLKATTDENLANFAASHTDPVVRWEAATEWQRRRAANPSTWEPLDTDAIPRIPGGPVGPDKYGSPEWKADLAKVNPNWQRGEEWQVNCTNTTTSWELRQRGYDVTAKPRPTREGRTTAETSTAWDADVADWSTKGTLRQMHKRMLDEYPEGARGGITVAWKGGGAHIFNWEIHGGKVRWIDGQSNKHGTDLMDFLPRVKGGANVMVERLDHLPLSRLLGDFVSWD